MLTKMKKSSVIAILAFASLAGAQPARTIVVTSPGSPGSTDDAQPRMDSFAGAVSARAHTQLGAVYEPSDAAGARRLAESGIGMVSLPFFLAHEQELGLRPRLQVVAKGRPALETWALVAQKGRVELGEGTRRRHDRVDRSRSRRDSCAATCSRASARCPRARRSSQSTRGAVGVAPGGGRRAGRGRARRRSAGLARIAAVREQARGRGEVAGRCRRRSSSRSIARCRGRTWAALEPALLGLDAKGASEGALAGIEVTRFEHLDDKALAARARHTGSAAVSATRSLVLVLVLGACTSALHEPQPVAQLAPGQSHGRSADELVRDARPRVDASRRAGPGGTRAGALPRRRRPASPPHRRDARRDARDELPDRARARRRARRARGEGGRARPVVPAARPAERRVRLPARDRARPAGARAQVDGPGRARPMVDAPAPRDRACAEARLAAGRIACSRSCCCARRAGRSARAIPSGARSRRARRRTRIPRLAPRTSSCSPRRSRRTMPRGEARAAYQRALGLAAARAPRPAIPRPCTGWPRRRRELEKTAR